MRLTGEAARQVAADVQLVGVVPAEMAVLPGTRPTSGQVDFQPDHTHLLAVPGAAWGDETAWLFTAGEVIAGKRPLITVVLNGGDVTWREAAESVRRQRPVLAVAGTGRAADVVASADADGPGPVAADRVRARDLLASGLVEAVGFDEDVRLRATIERVLGGEGSASAPRATRLAAATPAPARDGGMTATTGARGSFEDEVGALIDALELTEERRQFLASRWLDQIGYMGARANEAKKRYHRFRLATVIGGVIVPALVSISLAGSGRFDPDLDFAMRLVTFVISAIVAVTAAVEGFFHFGDRWRHFRATAEALKSEGWQFLTRSGAYRNLDDAEERFQAFAARVESVLREDVEGFMTGVARTAPIEKHDIFTRV
jgi:hypothetical protein